jgi:hypothetical protein
MKNKRMSKKREDARIRLWIGLSACVVSFVLGTAFVRPVTNVEAAETKPVVTRSLPMAEKKAQFIEVKGTESYEAAEARHKWTPEAVERRIRELAAEAHFAWPDYLVRLAKCESGLNPAAVNVNKDGSKDVGLFQINERYHPEVSDAVAKDIDESTKWTMWRINSGHQAEWMCDPIVRKK